METVAEAAEVKTEDILGHDLFPFMTEPGYSVGVNEEFVSAPADWMICSVHSLHGGFLQGT